VIAKRKADTTKQTKNNVSSQAHEQVQRERAETKRETRIQTKELVYGGVIRVEALRERGDRGGGPGRRKVTERRQTMSGPNIRKSKAAPLPMVTTSTRKKKKGEHNRCKGIWGGVPHMSLPMV